MKRRSLLLVSIAAFGYALLYVPIMSVVIYSFNDSRLVTLWGGFSTRWYASLLTNEELLAAAWLSLRVSSTVSGMAKRGICSRHWRNSSMRSCAVSA